MRHKIIASFISMWRQWQCGPNPLLAKAIMKTQIMYYGRISEFLMVTSECIVITDEGYTLEQILNRLRQREARWAYELADSHVLCSIDGQLVALSDHVGAGCELWITSRKSIFEA